MDKQSAVVFRNVGQVYFPQTRVECHYSVTSEHRWSSSDWIGIFETGCSSLKQYHTYTWALVPEGYTEGTSVDCCTLFQASYLPRPSAAEYHFIYVDKMGKVCGRSRPFTFRAPKPLEELETLKEEQDEEEEGEEELLLVVPRAQLLQSRLDGCLKEQAHMQQALDVAEEEAQNERKSSRKAREEWEQERKAMKEEISELRDSLRQNCELMKKMEGKHKNVKYSQENLTCELSRLMAEKAESEQRVKELEEDMEVLKEQEKEETVELDRLKERVKRTSTQMKHDEEKRKSLQAENEAALVEVRGLQERLEVSEHLADSLRRELRELGSRQAQTHTELHQARLQAAQLSLLLSEENLVLREERASCALEREVHKHAAEADAKKIQELSWEVQRKEEWLQEERAEREKLEAKLGQERESNRVLLSDAKRELQELKATARKAQKERREQQEEQELRSCISESEHSFGISSSEDDEDASNSPLLLSDIQNKADGDTQDVMSQQSEHQADEKQLILKELLDPVLSDLADSPVW